MSSEVETSLTICPLQNIERFLDFARNDKLEKPPPVHIWKQIISHFALREKFSVDILFLELLRQFLEARKMIGHSLRSVIIRCAVADERRPIAGLREQEFARELAQDAIIISHCLSATRFCQRGHASVRREKMWINPAAFLIEPDTQKTLITPARGRWLRHLLGRILLEKLARRGQPRSVFRSRQNHLLKKDRSLKPPMSEELGIERHCHNWIPVVSSQTLKFGGTPFGKMVSMPACHFFRGRAIIKLFRRNLTAGNAMIFNSGKAVFG